jgi:hypothetical protein
MQGLNQVSFLLGFVSFILTYEDADKTKNEEGHYQIGHTNSRFEVRLFWS